MSRRFVVDSDVLIDYQRGQQATREFLRQLHGDDLAVSHLTYAELLVGELDLYKPEEAQRRTSRFLSGYEILPIDDEVINRWAELNALLSKRGQMIGLGDLFIAATALIHNRILVTRNLRHFSRIPDLPILDARVGS